MPEAYLPDVYTASNQQQYKIRSSDLWTYWNRLEPSTSNEKNNWSDAGLQYWLNDTETSDGYLTKLSSYVKGKLVSVKHYLGTISFDKRYGGNNSAITDNTKEAYTNERAVTCNGGKGTIESSDGFTLGNACRVWKDNATIWTGKVSLIYPSDYGYAADSKYWSNKPLGNSSYTGDVKGGYNEEEVKTSNWMMSTMKETSLLYSWMLSPSSNGSNYAASWDVIGYVYGGIRVYSYHYGVRPVLSLSSSTTWISGDGTKENPYKIS